MKAPTWKQNVLLVSDDLEIKSSIAPAFGDETNLITATSTDEAIGLLHDTPLQVIIIDAKTTDVNKNYYEQYYDEKEEIPFIELSQLASQINQGLTVIVLVNKLLSREGEFARKCGAILIMDRKNILINRMVYLIDILRKRTFRTLLSRDIPIGTTFSVDIYHHLSLSNRYVVFLPAGTSFDESKLEKIKASNIRHLYVTEPDLPQVLTTLRTSNESTLYSENLASIRKQYRQLLIQLFDLSTDGMIHYGKMFFDKGMDIVSQIDSLVTRFPDPATCLQELPYPRWSAIAHSINCGIYASIFCKHYKIEPRNEIVFAAMFHNVGLSGIDQNLIRKSEQEMTSTELEEYKKHVFISMELLRHKLVPFTPLIEKLILYHHENYDGTGYPHGLAGELLSIEVAILPVLGSYDYFNTVRPLEKPLNPYEAWLKLLNYHRASTVLNKKFHPEIIEKLDQFFITHFKR